MGTDLQQKLARLGLLAIYTPDSDMQIVQACALKENDALVAISYSGETNKVLRVVQEAKNNLTPTIAITRIGGNTLTKRSDINLFVPNIESLFRQGATISRINQLMVVDIVYAMILSRFKEIPTRFSNAHGRRSPMWVKLLPMPIDYCSGESSIMSSIEAPGATIGKTLFVHRYFAINKYGA